MHTAKVVVISAALIVFLAGCASSPPITNKDVTVAIAATATTDLLPGDPMTLTTTGHLALNRTDKLAVAIESSTDRTTWATVKEATRPGNTLDLSFSVKLPKPGDLSYRVKVSTPSPESKVVSVSEPVKVTVFDVPAMTRTLYYNETQAFAKSTADGLAFDQANNYPGEFDTTGAAWAHGVAQLAASGIKTSAVPDLTTLSPTPTWTVPGSTCNAPGTTPPKGRTFIVTINESNTYTTYLPDSSKADVHVTLLDGKLYFYVPYCG